ncbi:MAG: hypothetical protein IT261_05355 [Saprospiraceae bacterium]|nr:hypothetical protein [Saprospiraceae bacterium]
MRYLLLTLSLFCLANLPSGLAQCDFQTSMLPTPVLCYGGKTGALNLTVTNAAPPVTYIWSNGVTTQDMTGLVAGLYTVTVTDGLGCTATADGQINQPAAALTVSFPIYELNCITTTVQVAPNVSGGTPPYSSYNWSNGPVTAEIPVSFAGTYTVTVTDANNCTAIGSVTVTQSSSVPVTCIAPAPTLTCAVTSVVLNATCSSQGPNFVYSWTGPGLVSGQNTLTPTINQPGLYVLQVDDVQNGCSAGIGVTVVEDVTPPIANAGPDLQMPCGGGVVTLAGSSSIGPNFTYIWAGPGIVSGSTTLNPIINQPGVYQLVVTNIQNGCTSTDVVTVTQSSSGLCSQITGRVLEDDNLNCQTDAGDAPLNHWIVRAEGTLGTYFAVTDANGDYELFVEAGDTYQITAVPLSVLWGACAPIPDVAATAPNQTYAAQDLLFQKLAGCPLLTVDITSGNLRRCFSNNLFSVSYCNDGTEPATDAYVDVTLEPLFSILTSLIPYTDLGNNVFRFPVGDLNPGGCGSFYFTAHLSCIALVGQTHCTEAHIYPDTFCIPTNVQWSGASLRIQSTCAADSVRFEIKNVGIGNMTEALEYIVIEDQIMLMSAPVQLDAGQSVIVSVPANGSTWRLEMEQEPFHPGFSQPSVSVEGCTTGPTFSTGFVNMFPQDDADPYLDIHCLANTGSYDPNDKTGFPLGYGAQRYIKPGTPLEYLIRFQNTGNDTAFTVRIEDTLSQWLDPATFRPGASSHAYSWNLSGAGLLTFLFENILLPDSNVNEPASHGFVKFNIRHKEEAPLETVIENTALIYFDFNDAIVTNTTSHRLGENFVTVGLWQPGRPQYAVQVTPNPLSDAALLEIKGLSSTQGLQLQVFDLQGSMRLEMRADQPVFRLNAGFLPAGTYLFHIVQEGRMVGTGKLMVQ